MEKVDKVSIIIPTYNRFENLLNTIKSVKEQTYKNIEIIVVNDCSTQKEYYEYNFGDDIKVIHLKENTRIKFGYPCVGYVINCGIDIYTGDYFATCDDDDCWLPNKLELQLNAIKETGCKMSCTDGFIGKGIYDSNKKYKKYNAEHYFKILKNKYEKKGNNELENGFPKIWNENFIKIHNCIIACSILIHKDIIDKIGKQLEIKMGGTWINKKYVHIDYDYWLRALQYTDCVYIDKPCIYYDESHGGQKKRDYH